MRLGKRPAYILHADERSRTSTGLPPQAPEACASANSATSAGNGNYCKIRTLAVKQIAGFIKSNQEMKVDG